MLLAQLGTDVVDTVQFGPGLVKQLPAGRDRGADRAGEDAGVGLGRAVACVAREAWLAAAPLVVVAGVAVGLGVPVGPGAIVAVTLIGCCCRACAAGGGDPVSVIATAPAAVIAATAATRTAIQGHSPHSA